jgi:hypothetical protein
MSNLLAALRFSADDILLNDVSFKNVDVSVVYAYANSTAYALIENFKNADIFGELYEQAIKNFNTYSAELAYVFEKQVELLYSRTSFTV